MDTFKRAQKIQRLAHGCSIAIISTRFTPNKNEFSAMTPTEIMLAKLIPNNEKFEHTVQKTGKKIDELGKRVFLNVSDGEKYWEVGTIGKMIYLVKGPDIVHKRHLNQTKNRHIDEENDTPMVVEPMEVLFQYI